MENSTDFVYMTKANSDRLLRNIKSYTIDPDYDELYKSDLRHILSIPELNLLYVTMEVYKDFDKALEIYTRLEIRPDTKDFAFEGGSPTYHADSSCTRLKSDFVNLEIPIEIKSKGDVDIEKFRSFCRKHMDLLRSDETQFMNKLSARFLLKNVPTKIVFDNTGSVDFFNLDLKQLEERIDQLLVDSDLFRNKTEETAKLINEMGYGTHKIKEAKVKGNDLNIWHEKYKGNLKKLMREYFRVKFNPELKFEGKLLGQLGFRACRQCSST